MCFLPNDKCCLFLSAEFCAVLKIKQMTTFWITIVLTICFAGIAYAQSKRNVPQTKVVMTINAPIDTAFNHIVPVELSHIFKKYRSIAGITNTSIKEGWTKPGLIRTVCFEYGSTSKETLLTVVPHSSFSYKIEDFTSGLRFLAKRIEGDWIFTDLCNGQTKIEWTYKVVPKNFMARGLINLFLMKDITGLLNKALATLKDDLESIQYQNASR
jgi:Polyketide cyclase / dehydrase and lipid transport